MRVNAPRGATILPVKKDERRRSGAFTTITGRFLDKTNIGAFGPTGRFENTGEKAHTSQTRGDTKNREKSRHLSHAHGNTKAEAVVDQDATQQHRQGSRHRYKDWWPIKLSGKLASSSWSEDTREDTAAPVPASDFVLIHVATHIPGITFPV